MKKRKLPKKYTIKHKLSVIDERINQEFFASKIYNNIVSITRNKDEAALLTTDELIKAAIKINNLCKHVPQDKLKFKITDKKYSKTFTELPFITEI